MGLMGLMGLIGPAMLWLSTQYDPADDLRILVTGPGITPFEARHVAEDVGCYQVGMHVPVDVDPRSNLFRLVE